MTEPTDTDTNTLLTDPDNALEQTITEHLLGMAYGLTFATQSDDSGHHLRPQERHILVMKALHKLPPILSRIGYTLFPSPTSRWNVL